jgi:predicted cupin superfamily sugar epimerase
MTDITAKEIIKLLNLIPLQEEGGYYAETYKSSFRIAPGNLPRGYESAHSLSTAIYYLITPKRFSRMHRLPADEVWHFYFGDAAEQLQLFPDGTGKIVTLGNHIGKGEVLQTVVPASVWQGTILKPGGRFALFGTTMSPGFEFSDYQPGDADQLIRSYPQFEKEIILHT